MEKEKRKLSKGEEKRKKLYEEKKKELIEQGYEEKDLTISVVYANIMALVLGLPIIIFLFIIFIYQNQSGVYRFSFKEPILFLVVFAILIVLHELIHGITWSIFAKNHLKSIEFGLIISSLTPYCCCKDMLTKSQYIVGGIMPTVVLGIIPALISIFTGSVLVYYGRIDDIVWWWRYDDFTEIIEI